MVVGPEFVTGSTRLKSGTAQKLVLNMITTCTFIQLGHVKGNKMVDMQLTNHKLIERGTRMVMEQTGLSHEHAHELLLKAGSVRKAVDSVKLKYTHPPTSLSPSNSFSHFSLPNLLYES